MSGMVNFFKEVDFAILYFFNSIVKNPITDVAMSFLSKYGYLLFIPFILYAFFREKKSFYFLLFIILTILFADFISNTLKNIIMRPRPFFEHNIINLEGVGRSFSMPSNHATNAFAVAYFLRRYYKNFSLLVLLASLITISRIFLGVHYPSDILVGAILGIVTGKTMFMFYNNILKLKKRQRYKSYLILILLVISIFRILYIKYSPIDLSGDEAHYWEWSRHLDMSYYSKGPLISYIIFLGTRIFGNTELGVRFFAVFFSFFSSLLMYEATYLISKNDKKSFLSGLLMQIIPFFSFLGIIMTIDSPFLYFWILGMYLVLKMVCEDSLSNVFYWIFLGLIVGMGMLAKYTMIFFYPSLVLFLLLYKGFEKLRKTWVYITVFTSLIIFSPVIFWNHIHGWVTLKHTAYHARLEKGLVISFSDFFEFLISQIGLMTPFIFMLMLYAFTKIKNIERKFCISFFLPVFVFFTLKSLQGKVEANWPMVAYPSGIIALSLMEFKREKFVTFSCIFALMITIIGYFSPYLYFLKAKNPAIRVLGWENLGKKIDYIQSTMKNQDNIIIFTDDYQLSSLLSFYTSSKPFVFCVNYSGRRMNQYDIWAYKPDYDINNHIGKDAIFITKSNNYFYDFLMKLQCNHYEKIKEILYNKHVKVRDVYIYKCYGLKSIINLPIRRF